MLGYSKTVMKRNIQFIKWHPGVLSRLMLVVLVVLLSQMAQTARAGIYSIRILPSVTQAATGATFDVVLQANMVVDTKATGFVKGSMTYPTTLVQLVSVTPGQYPELSITTSSGLITVSSPDKGAGNGYGGQLAILTAKFKVIAGGTATFSANNGSTSGVMIVNGTNHVVVDGTVTTIGCPPGYTGVFPNCVAPVVPPATTPPTTTTSASTATTPTTTIPTTTTSPTAVSNTPNSTTPTTQPSASIKTENELSQTTLSTFGQIDAVLDKCLSATFGVSAYEKLVKDQARLSYEQVASARRCFSQRSSVIPDELAPIDPVKVKNLPINSTLKLDKIEQVASNNSKAIRLSGKARKNQTVIIYLFSDPVVLVAKADGDGNWEYTLKDPMEPGNHQAYVTVEYDDKSAVRSSTFGFAVAAAPKTATNPLGLSLTLQKNTSKLVYVYYVAGTIIVVALALLVIVRTMRRLDQSKHEDGSSALPPVDPTGPRPVVGGA